MADFTQILSQLQSLKGRVDQSLSTVVDDIVTAVKAVETELRETENQAKQNQANAPTTPETEKAQGTQDKQNEAHAQDRSEGTTKAESQTTPKGSTATSTHSPVERR